MKKKFLIITGVIVLFMALLSYWGYNKYFKPDPEIQEQLNNQFGADFFTLYDDQNVVNKSGTVNNENSKGDTNSKNDGESNYGVQSVDNLSEENDNSPTSSPVDEKIVAKQVTQADIISKYRPQFNYLQNVALSRLDTLYSAAIQEYAQGSKAGTLNRSQLVQKYIQAGNMLEANVDSQFYGTLNAMQAELIAHDLPTDIVSVKKIEYEKAKSDKRSQLLAKVRK